MRWGLVGLGVRRVWGVKNCVRARATRIFTVIIQSHPWREFFVNKDYNLTPVTSYNLRQITVSFIAIGFCFSFLTSSVSCSSILVIVLIAIALILKLGFEENFNDLFFNFKRFHTKAIWLGLISACLLSLFFRFAWDPFINRVLPQLEYDLSDMAFIKGNLVNYIIIMVMALLAGGFYEELFFMVSFSHGLSALFRGGMQRRSASSSRTLSLVCIIISKA